MATSSQHEQSHGQLTTVAVQSYYPINQCALEALVSIMPGLQLVPLATAPPPQVLLWEPGPGQQAMPPNYAPETAMLVLLGETDTSTLPSHATGLLTKDETLTTLMIAIQQVAHGRQYLSPALAQASHSDKINVLQANLETLTSRERELLVLLSEGLSNRDIADQLSLSTRTVEGHLANLYTKLGVRSRIQAALIAIRHNITA